MSELDEIGIRHNTDKSSVSRMREPVLKEERKAGHDYPRKYEFFLRRFLEQPGVRMLELGIGPDWNMGASANVWIDYFTADDFSLHMVDINPNAARFAGGKISVSVGDLGDTMFLKTLAAGSHDIVIDDASHFWSHQIDAFLHLFDSLMAGGVYVVEDIHTSFGPSRESYRFGAAYDAQTAMLTLASLVAGNRRAHPSLESGDSPILERLKRISQTVESVTFIKSACIVCKQGFYK